MQQVLIPNVKARELNNIYDVAEVMDKPYCLDVSDFNPENRLFRQMSELLLKDFVWIGEEKMWFKKTDFCYEAATEDSVEVYINNLYQRVAAGSDKGVITFL